jgi:radical SAM superfamily enzyme YgiQ (UPF0313 family)
MDRNPVLLIAFYNKKALGVRYLERALTRSGLNVYVLFLKGFNSRKPQPVSFEELLLLKSLVNNLKPGLIGLSVMSSLYLESVVYVNNFLRDEFRIPIVWGGVYASMFPKKCLEYADFVLRGECEEAIVELSLAVLNRTNYKKVKNLAFMEPLGDNSGKAVINSLRPLCEDLDLLGYPVFGLNNKYYIEGSRIGFGDPMTESISYELSCSRGCPFMCSYCCSINLKRMYAGHGKYLRFRSVASVIGELEEALSYMKSLKVIHFWDEIFPDDNEWIEAFTTQYKARIGLPFEIWAHPLKIDNNIISKLADAGLHKVVMGIQSGSPKIRKEVFHRPETQENLLEAAKILSKNKIPQVVYDFILRHPFEGEDDIKQTYQLCALLKRPFELQLHGLSFFPGTDIEGIAERKGIVATNLTSGQNRKIGDIYKNYWGQKNNNVLLDYWYSLIYISQFKFGLLLSEHLSKRTPSSLAINIVLMLRKLFQPVYRIRYLYKKAKLLTIAYSNKSSAASTTKYGARHDT